MLDVQHGQLGFTKGCIVAEIAFSFSWILIAVNLTLNAVSFGSSLYSFWRWTCVCSMLLRRMTFQVNVFEKSLLNNRLRS
ncbi:DUF645 family protein [Vibrio cholerae]|nr:DUF645 family protein [Vibrio cholerae]EGR0601546.1 DUF645 family protein [Vibrio cholerae]